LKKSKPKQKIDDSDFLSSVLTMYFQQVLQVRLHDSLQEALVGCFQGNPTSDEIIRRCRESITLSERCASDFPTFVFQFRNFLDSLSGINQHDISIKKTPPKQTVSGRLHNHLKRTGQTAFSANLPPVVAA
jgi:hypothetical protein